MIRRDQVAFPEFKGPAPHRRLVSDGTQDETAVGFEVVILKEDLSALVAGNPFASGIRFTRGRLRREHALRIAARVVCDRPPKQ